MDVPRQCILLASDFYNQEEFAILVSSLVYLKNTWNYPVYCSLARSAVEVAFSTNQVGKIDCRLDTYCDPLMNVDSIYENRIISADEALEVSQQASFQLPREDWRCYPVDETEEHYRGRLSQLLFREIEAGAVILAPAKSVATCLAMFGQFPAMVPMISLWNVDRMSFTATLQWQQGTEYEMKAILQQYNSFLEVPPEPLLQTRKPLEMDTNPPPVVHPPLDEETNRLLTQLAEELGIDIADIVPETKNPMHQLLAIDLYALKASKKEINRLKDVIEKMEQTEQEKVSTLTQKFRELQEVAPLLRVFLNKEVVGVKPAKEEKQPEQDMQEEQEDEHQENPENQGRELKCSECGQVATFFCLCIPAKFYLCSQCRGAHVTKEGTHPSVPIEANSYVNQPSDLALYNMRLEITNNTEKAIDLIFAAVEEEEKSLSQNIAEERQKVIDEVNKVFESLQQKMAAKYQAVRETVEQGKNLLHQFKKNAGGKERKAMDRWASLSVHFAELPQVLFNVGDFARESIAVRIEEIQREVNHPIHIFLEKWDRAACDCEPCETARRTLLLTSADPNKGKKGEYDSCFVRKNQANIGEMEVYVLERQGEGALQVFKQLAAKWENPSISCLFRFTQALLGTDMCDEQAARSAMEAKGYNFR